MAQPNGETIRRHAQAIAEARKKLRKLEQEAAEIKDLAKEAREKADAARTELYDLIDNGPLLPGIEG